MFNSAGSKQAFQLSLRLGGALFQKKMQDEGGGSFCCITFVPATGCQQNMRLNFTFFDEAREGERERELESMKGTWACHTSHHR